MSNSWEIMNRGSTYCFIPFFEDNHIFVLDVGRVPIEAETTGTQINLAPNHQDYTPSHRKNRRGKFKGNNRK